MKKLYCSAGTWLLLVLLALAGPALAQTKPPVTITGKVLADKGSEALPGVTVLLKGTTNGTGTAPDGSFSLSVPGGEGTLVFSYVGYLKREIPINGKTTVNISLSSDDAALDEVVVVGYGTQKARDVTGAVAGVTAKEIEERPVNRIENALAGQMPGVYVQTTSGEPGAELQIRVRGTASINASNEPLYVVDGVPVDNLRGINPTDVASLEVLKDAASAAIYGSRGSNGVVLVTTKRGKAGETRLQFSGFTGVQVVESKLKVQSAEDWITMRREGVDEAWVNRGKTAAVNKPYKATDSQAYRAAELGATLRSPNPTYMYDPKWQYGTDSLAYTNWQDALFHKAIMQQYTIGASGGSDKVTYNVNGSYLDQDGIIIGTNLRRATLRANINANIRKGIKFTMTLAPSMEWNSLGRVDGTGGQALNASQMPPVGPKDAGVYVGAQPYRTYAWSGNYISPIAVLERSQVSGERTRLNANMGLNFDLYKGLQLQLLGGMDNGYYNDQQYYPTSASQTWYNAAYEGQLSRSRLYQTYTTHYLFQGVLNYVRTFGGVHNLNAIAGYAAERNGQKDTQQENNTLPNDWSYLFDRTNSTVGTSRILETTPAVLLSYFGRVQYDYKQKYLVAASLRRDGSSRFGSRKPFGYFPALSLGWRVSDEAFMRDIKFITDLKFRASYGVTGNNRIPANSQYSILGVQNYSLNGTAVTGYSPSSIDNPDLRWERTGSFNVGFDFYLLSSRLGITFDAYDKKTTDLLYTAPVSAVTGFTSSFQNIGDIRNQGLELGINSVNLTGAVQWTTSFNTSFNRNKILRLGFDDTPVPGGFTNLTSILQVGQPISSYLLYDAIGVYQTQAEVDAGPKMSGTRVGDAKYRDVNGDGVITNDDRTIVGNPQPSFIYGLTNTFRYKNFDLSVLVNAQTGGQLYSLIGRSIDRPGMGYLYNHLENWNNRWKSEAEPGDGKTPSISATTGAYFDSRWLYSSNYLRIKNVTLGYNLPKASFYQSARFYLALENAYIWHSYIGGYSPEALQAGGYDNGSYPQFRSYSIGFNVAL